MKQRTKKPAPTVVVGMSGGVDSSVAALLLQEQGYRVIGLFMRNWDESGAGGECTAAQDFEDVERVCSRLGIPYYGVEFVEAYRDQVFQDMVEGYKKGITPNPDILCNREIKFKVFFDKAMELGADYLATGHYCRRGGDEASGYHLLKGADENKDQSYFLYTIQSEILKKVLFPIGELPKSEVRRRALEAGLITHNKKDSTGICFIGKRKFTEFLSQFVSYRPGSFQTLEGEVVGEHRGAAFYTLGQRKGLGLGGAGEPFYVVSKDMDNNIVFVERGAEHPALYSQSLSAIDPSWVGLPPRFPLECKAKVRYRQKDQSCKVFEKEGKLRVEFEEPQRAITPGQSVVFYEGTRCLGGAFIETAFAQAGLTRGYWEKPIKKVPKTSL